MATRKKEINTYKTRNLKTGSEKRAYDAFKSLPHKAFEGTMAAAASAAPVIQQIEQASGVPYNTTYKNTKAASMLALGLALSAKDTALNTVSTAKAAESANKAAAAVAEEIKGQSILANLNASGYNFDTKLPANMNSVKGMQQAFSAQNEFAQKLSAELSQVKGAEGLADKIKDLKNLSPKELLALNKVAQHGVFSNGGKLVKLTQQQKNNISNVVKNQLRISKVEQGTTKPRLRKSKRLSRNLKQIARINMANIEEYQGYRNLTQMMRGMKMMYKTPYTVMKYGAKIAYKTTNLTVKAGAAATSLTLKAASVAAMPISRVASAKLAESSKSVQQFSKKYSKVTKNLEKKVKNVKKNIKEAPKKAVKKTIKAGTNVLLHPFKVIKNRLELSNPVKAFENSLKFMFKSPKTILIIVGLGILFVAAIGGITGGDSATMSSSAVILSGQDQFKDYQAKYDACEATFQNQVSSITNGKAHTPNLKGDIIDFGINTEKQYKNGLNLTYLYDGMAISGISSNIVDCLSAMTVIMQQNQSANHAQALELLEAIYKSTHAYSTQESSLYPCDEGCAETPYFCNENHPEIGGTNPDLTVNEPTQTQKYWSTDMKFAPWLKNPETLPEPTGECPVCKYEGHPYNEYAGCTVTSTCYHNEGESYDYYFEDGEKPDWISHCDNVRSVAIKEEYECESENCSGHVRTVGYTYTCKGHDHYSCPGHTATVCFGHIDLYMQISIASIKKIFDLGDVPVVGETLSADELNSLINKASSSNADSSSSANSGNEETNESDEENSSGYYIEEDNKDYEGYEDDEEIEP